MDDKTWEKILTYVFKVERLCLEQLWIKPEDKRFIRIDLPTIAGVTMEPLISYQMMKKVDELIR